MMSGSCAVVHDCSMPHLHKHLPASYISRKGKNLRYTRFDERDLGSSIWVDKVSDFHLFEHICMEFFC